MKTNKLNSCFFSLFLILFLCIGGAWGDQYGEGNVFVTKDVASFFNQECVSNDLNISSNARYKLHFSWMVKDGVFSTSLSDTQYLKPTFTSNKAGVTEFRDHISVPNKGAVEYIIDEIKDDTITYTFAYYPPVPPRSTSVRNPGGNGTIHFAINNKAATPLLDQFSPEPVKLPNKPDKDKCSLQ